MGTASVGGCDKIPVTRKSSEVWGTESDVANMWTKHIVRNLLGVWPGVHRLDYPRSEGSRMCQIL